jgi:hypothetical protein
MTMRDTIPSARKEGRRLDYPQQFRFVLAPDERQRLERLAAAKGVSMAAILRAGIALMAGDSRGRRYTSHADTLDRAAVGPK